MPNGNLSLQQAPPLSVPGRFFLTAPVFGIAACLIMLLFPGELFLSRWTPGLLAVTHCLVLGFFASIMLGAVQQMLPVLAGAPILRPRLVAAIIHCQWVPAVALLVLAFLSPAAWLFLLALILLAGAVLAFLCAVVFSLRQSDSRSESVPGIKLATFSLLVTLLLGIGLVAGYAGMVPLWRPLVTDLHLSWGLLGWIAVLIMSVAWQVVPMFQITPAYPVWFRRSMVPVTLALLMLKSLLALLGQGPWVVHATTITDLMIAAGLTCFAVITLHIQGRSRRKVQDSHRGFWRLAMLNLIASCLLWVLAEATGEPLLDLLAASAFLLGFVMAVMTGMLLKIVAFLVWLHLSAANDALELAGKPGIAIPKMKAIISSRSSRALLILLPISGVAMLAALVFPQYFTRLAALLWLGYFCLLGMVIGRALLQYRSIAKQVLAAA
ncbi:MAG TPA: hypothetical protein VI566_12140 [Xanthomonadales bacterium]|nr:hypothetical protein [Xanthomonadales bacterium]